MEPFQDETDCNRPIVDRAEERFDVRVDGDGLVLGTDIKHPVICQVSDRLEGVVNRILEELRSGLS